MHSWGLLRGKRWTALRQGGLLGRGTGPAGLSPGDGAGPSTWSAAQLGSALGLGALTCHWGSVPEPGWPPTGLTSGASPTLRGLTHTTQSS